ncbi:MAG: transcriptional regulator [Sphingomonadaceae bacterium]
MGRDDEQAGRVHHFGPFRLDEEERQLWRGGERLPLNPRYFDALVLLVRERGRLVGKERFFEQVWRGVTVGDEALTQCITSLRRALGDSPANPRFIETVPKQGYRFIAPVESGSGSAAGAGPAAEKAPRAPALETLRVAAFGTLGGGGAGVLGGISYGLAAGGGGAGAASVLLVLLAVSVAAGLIGALGIGAGMAAASLVAGERWRFSMVGAAASGLVAGSLLNILATDSFHILLGRTPESFTGGLEGAALGAALAAGARLGGGIEARSWRPSVAAAFACAAMGAAISIGGGKLVGGSLAELAGAFEDSRLDLDLLGRFSGENMFGPVAQAIAAGMEGFVFGLCVTAGMLIAHRARPAPGLFSPAPS